MSPFERHNITHLSASSLNAWATQPALWVMERLLKKSAPVGCAAHRGTAVEHGVTEGLLNPSLPITVCQAAAESRYDALVALNGDPNREKEREVVKPSVALALAELRQYGIPQAQVKITKTLDPSVPPAIGFVDFFFPDSGIVMDLKTTGRIPSEIPDAHRRQVGLYIHDTNHQGRLMYVSSKRLVTYQLEDAAQHVEALRQIALRLGKFLALSSDPHELAGLLVPDYDHFYWSSAIARAHGKDVFGF